MLRHLLKLDEWLAGATLAAMLLLGAAAMVARGLGSPIIWSEEVLRNVILWLTMLGALAVTRRGEHIVVSLGLPNQRNTTFRLVFQSVIDATSAVCCAVFAYYATLYLLAFGTVNLITLPKLPLWVFMISTPLCLSLMAIAFIARGALPWIRLTVDDRA